MRRFAPPGLTQLSEGRNRFAWYLLLLWTSLLGVQAWTPWLTTVRFAPADVVMLIITVVLIARSPKSLIRAARRTSPPHYLLIALAIALAFGSVVALWGTGVLVDVAAINKVVGFSVLAATFLAVRTIVEDEADVRTALLVLLVSGTIVTWIGWLLEAIGLRETQYALRFDAFLLNPTSNGLFIGLLLAVQVGAVAERTERDLRLWLMRLNAVGLALLLVATLSRSSVFAVVAMLAFLTIALPRGRSLPIALLLVGLLFNAQPLGRAILPVWEQLSQGRAPSGRFVEGPVASPSGARSAEPAISTASSSLQTPAPTAPQPVPSASAAATTTPSVPETAAPPLVAQVGSKLDQAALIAGDQNGLSDRIALDALAIRWWFASPSTVITGIGLGVFYQRTPETGWGVPIIIHSTYVWLPVEMGIAGVAALVALVITLLWAVRLGLRTEAPLLKAALVGGIVLLAVWISVNEGLYQRSFWLLVALASVLPAPGPKRPHP